MRARTILLTTIPTLAAIATVAGCLLEITPVDHWCGEGWEAEITGAEACSTQQCWPIPVHETSYEQCMTMREDALLIEGDTNDPEFNAIYDALVAQSESECTQNGPAYIESGTPASPTTTCADVDGGQTGDPTSSVSYEDTCWEEDDEGVFEYCWDNYYDCEGGGTGEGGWNCNDDPDTSAAGFEQLSTLITCTSSPDECTVDADFLDQWWYGPDGIDEDGSLLVRHEDATGAPDGWEVKGCATDNLCDELGFENGDIITKINDVDCLDVEDAIAIWLDEYDDTTNDIVLDVDYKRGRENKSIEITIERT